ncbi:hypothetical protein BX265_5482 [Streptomyces sp. TLI_235]|nr:hypothetical protein [Streptomyces sp. TLI_235]PBC70922.1 hypothetical protein BX265_5482 [Streptomyces sp. TLI_235]
MTISALPWLPLPATLDQVARVVGRGAELAARADGDTLAAARLAAEAGGRAAAWVRQLAVRQADPAHARALAETARAIARAGSHGIVLGGERLAEEDRRALAGRAVLGAADTAVPPDLYPGERTALLAACTLAAALPSVEADRRAAELRFLAAELAATAAAGQLVAAARAARLAPVDSSRLVPGPESGDGPRARAAHPAHRGLGERAFYVFELVLAHQGGTGEESRREALAGALDATARGLAAAALLGAADDPALGLDDEQRQYLTRLAADLDPRVTRDMRGSEGGGPAAGRGVR